MKAAGSSKTFIHMYELHVYGYKQYSKHTLILDTVFEFAGQTDPFSDDADKLSESVPLFDVS
jgi:hypothetical protein